MIINFEVQFPGKGGHYDFNYNTMNANPNVLALEGSNIYDKSILYRGEGELNIEETRQRWNDIIERLKERERIKQKMPQEYIDKEPDLKNYVIHYDERDRELGMDTILLLNDNKKMADYIDRLHSTSEGALLREFHAYKKEAESSMRDLRKKVNAFDDEGYEELNNLRGKIEALKANVDTKEDMIKQLNKRIEEFDKEQEENLKNISQMKRNIEEKNLQFDELNRYINDLLREKKRRRLQLDEQKKQIGGLRRVVRKKDPSFKFENDDSDEEDGMLQAEEKVSKPKSIMKKKVTFELPGENAEQKKASPSPNKEKRESGESGGFGTFNKAILKFKKGGKKNRERKENNEASPEKKETVTVEKVTITESGGVKEKESVKEKETVNVKETNTTVKKDFENDIEEMMND